jgi:hypothetical protein
MQVQMQALLPLQVQQQGAAQPCFHWYYHYHQHSHYYYHLHYPQVAWLLLLLLLLWWLWWLWWWCGKDPL